MTIAFVGLGAMGLPMARNLVARGFATRGFDLRANACAALAEAGGTPAPSLQEALRGAECAILMVVNLAQAQAVLSAQNLALLARGATVVVMATCPPAGVAALAARVGDAGYGFVDAPVSGGVVGATAGSLTIMAAGPDDSLARVRPVLEALGSKLVRVGSAPGQGATAKAVNQLLCGAHIAIAAEALSLAEKLGVDTAVMLDIVQGSAAGSWMLRDRGPRMLQSDPEITSAIDIFVKDLGIVLDAGRDARTALPMAAVAHQLFLAVSGSGQGSADDSQVIRAYRGLQHLPTTSR